MSPAGHRWYEFGDYRLDASSGVLLKGTRIIALRPKTVETLRALVERRGELVSKDELMNEVWPGSFVEEAGLARNISELRAALGRHDHHRYIETLSKRGYRISVVVTAVEASNATTTPTLLVFPFRSETKRSRPYRDTFNNTLLERLACIREVKIAAAGQRDAGRSEVGAAFEQRADYAITGTFELLRTSVQVTFQLLKVASKAMVWSESFCETVGDLRQAQENICEEIAGAIALKFGTDEGKLLSRRYVQNSEGYQAYLRGRFYWNRRSEAGLRRAIEHFEQAIDLDPEYAPAFSGLADCYAMLPMVSAAPPRKFMPKAKSAALNALEIDESLVEARSSLAFVKWHYNWNWAAAERDYKRILKFHPELAPTHLSYALLLVESGRFGEALEHAQRARRLERNSISIGANYAMVLHLANRDEDAIATAREVLAGDESSVRARWAMGLAFQQIGRTEEAIAEFERMIRDFGETPSALGSLGFLLGKVGRSREAGTLLDRVEHGHERCPYDRALIYLGLGKDDDALQSLEEAWEQHSFHLVMLKVDRRMCSLRSQARFEELLCRIHLN